MLSFWSFWVPWLSKKKKKKKKFPFTWMKKYKLGHLWIWFIVSICVPLDQS